MQQSASRLGAGCQPPPSFSPLTARASQGGMPQAGSKLGPSNSSARVLVVHEAGAAPMRNHVQQAVAWAWLQHPPPAPVPHPLLQATWDKVTRQWLQQPTSSQAGRWKALPPTG